MHGHSNSHSHRHTHHADIWTNLAAAGELVTSLISDAYWLASVFDVVSGFKEDAIGVSYYALTFGAVAASLSAAGSSYCHRILNVTHQSKAVESNDASDNEVQHQGASLQNERALISEDTPLVPNEVPISNVQKLALLGDFISHTSNVAGPVTFVVNLASDGAMSRVGQAFAQVIACAFGVVFSVANWRSCKNAVDDANQLAAAR